jgi:CoA:oxalate CoA-transferase
MSSPETSTARGTAATSPHGHLDPTKPYPLSGFTAIDFTHVRGGPTCGRMLADAGARVIKVERPGGGDDGRLMGPFVPDGSSEYYRFANLGKESIALDLKDPADHALVKRMIARADVVVENFRPGVMANLNLDPAKLVEEFPRLIVCSISGFGQYGPMYQEAAYDTVIQAISGITDSTGAPDGPRVRVGTSISDILAGIVGYCGIVTALATREKTGRGTTVDISKLDSTFSLMEQGLMDALGGQIRPHRLGNRHPSMAPFDTYQCQDQMIAICCAHDRLFSMLAQTLGQPNLPSDPRFDTNVNLTKNQADLKAAMEAVLATQPAAAWQDRLEQAGIPCSLILNVDDTCRLEQIRVGGMVKDIDGYGVPGNSLDTMPPPPRLDEQGAALRAEFSVPAARGGD